MPLDSYSANVLLLILKSKNMTFDDLLEELKHEDEVTILELLNLNTHDLIGILESFIFDQQDRLRAYYGESPEDVGGEEVSD